MEQIRHRESCKPKDSNVSNEVKDDPQDMDESKPSISEAYDPLKIPYFCDECQQKVFLTSTQILRHKRSHQSLSTSETKPVIKSESCDEIEIKSEK